MINQVGNNAYQNIFVPLQNNGVPYAIVKPITQTQKQEVKKEGEKKTNRLGYEIAALALIAGLGILGIGRLSSKRVRGWVQNVVKGLEDKAEQSAAIDFIKNILHKSQTIFNVATVKDGIFKFLTPKGVDKRITSAFERLSVSTSKRAYDKTLSSFDSMFARFAEANKKLPAEQAREIETRIKNVRENYAQGFSETARNERFAQTKQALAGLFEIIFEQIKHPIAFLKRAKGCFIAEKEASKAKGKLQEIVKGHKDKIISEDKKGGIDEIMDIYRQHLKPADYERLQKSVNKSLKTFNKAINLESDKLFDKVRDLQLGSASHDVLAFLASLGLIGWGVSKADTKDEKISVTLKYGIPAISGVIIAMGCTVGLIASGPSLLIGLASTIPIHMIGDAIDNVIKKRQENPKASLLPAIDLKSPIKMIKDIENSNKSV